VIPYGRQFITEDDIEAVKQVLKSDFITQGPVVPEFENDVVNLVSAKHAVAVNSATSALHIACLALGLQEGDWLWTSPISFVASANCGLYCGAKISFVDIDEKTYNICPESLEKKLIEAKKLGQLPKVVVLVHYAGQSCDMRKIHLLSQEYNFKIIEDASHAIGGMYDKHYIGSCEYSDITVFSFHPVKIITTAEGGIATTNCTDLFKKMLLLRSHGISRDPNEMQGYSEGPWYYEQLELGFNYRMTEMQGALGRSQIKTIKDNINRRHAIAKQYHKELSNLQITLPYQSDFSTSSYHLFPIQLHLEKIKYSRKEVFNMLREQGIGVNVHYIPIHTQPFYKRLPYDLGNYPVAESFYEKVITIPLFHSMSDLEQRKVIESIKNIIG